MTNKHNKKRNTGLLYQFLIRTISECVVNKDDNLRDSVIEIIKKHFNKNSELYKEFRLFNSLIETNVVSTSVAETIIETARVASRQYDKEKLEREKSDLIRSINYTINKEGTFYDKRFNEYKVYATVQTLLNEWRSDRYTDIVKIAEYEDILKTWLLSKKIQETPVAMSEDVDPLVERLMLNKFNEKFGNNLNEEQKQIIKNYVFNEDDELKLKEYLTEIKKETLKEIDNYSNMENKSSYIREKLERTKVLIENISLEIINDEIVEKFLDVCKLKAELREI